MANIQGQKKWSEIRLLESHELARGGINGNLNEQAKALADRTEFLNQEKASKLEIIQGVFEFATYAEFNTIKSTLPLNCTVIINEINSTGTGSWNQGTNRWNGTTLTKSAYDPLAQAKTYTNSRTNLNIFKGFDQNSFPTGVVSAYKLEQSTTQVSIEGGRLALTLPTKGKIANTVSVWVKVSSAVLNSGVMRALVQVRKKDLSNAHSAYYNIPDATVDWYKLIDVNISSLNPADIDAVIVNPEATGGASLVLTDVYVGESSPNSTFSRIDRTEDDILRSSVKTNLIPNFDQLPIISGVTYGSDKISIGAGLAFDYTFPIADKQVLNFSMLVNQVSNRDTRFRFIGTPTDGSAGITRDLYTSAVNGTEFSSSVDFGKPIKQVRLNFSSITANAVSLDRFILSYDPVLQSKQVSQIKVPTRLSNLIDDTVVNIATLPKFEQLAVKTNATWTKNQVLLSGESNIVVHQRVADLGLAVGDVVYINLKGNVSKNGGVVSITQAQIKSDNSAVGGTATNLNSGSNLFLNIPVTIVADSQKINITLKTTVDAEFSATDLIISKEKVFASSVIKTLNAANPTGTQVSLFPYPKLTGYGVVGNTVPYNRYLDENNDWVLEVPNTDTTVARGQGASFTIDYPSQFIGSGGLLNIVLASPTTDTVTVYVVYKVGQAIVQELSSPVPMKNNGEFTEYLVRLAAKSSANANITSAVITFHQAKAATGPLKIKRPVLSNKLPFQNIGHIEYAIDQVAETGMPQRDRVYDALMNPVSGVFSTGQQMFVAEIDHPASVADFACVNGKRNLPEQLIGTKYIDASGWEVVTIDSDETVWLKNASNTNLYKTTVSDLFSRISATTLDGASGEQRGTFNGTGLTVVANNFAQTLWGKVAGDGSLICVNQTQAFYLPEGATSLVAATGYSDVKGGLITGWLFDVVDNIVLCGGYSAAQNYGKGKINFSNDFGRTYKTILDLENQTIFGSTATAKAHIHGCAWDKYWNRVWVVMGDYPFDSQATGKILWCDNPQDANPVWHIEPRDLIQLNKQNEQHIAVYPMQDCILFGSDCNPSYIARRARVSKDKATLTDMALYLHEGLAYYPGQFWQHKKDLPVTIFLGSDLLDRYGNNPDGVLITYDGVNFSRIWSDKNEYSNTSGRTSSYAYALTNERFLLQKRVDPRFASGICWVVGRLKA